jgi:hypothetical protein
MSLAPDLASAWGLEKEDGVVLSLELMPPILGSFRGISSNVVPVLKIALRWLTLENEKKSLIEPRQGQ